MDTQKLEQLVGAKALHLAGLVMVFFGSGFFLKVAFDHNWIAPPERVALGLVAGAALVAYAQFLAKRGTTFFSDGITALGAAIVFLSLWAANALFGLVPAGTVFGGMAATSAALAALGWRHRSERLGVFAAIAGYATPILVGSTAGNDWTLAGYLALLSCGTIALGLLIDAKSLAPLALAGSLAWTGVHFLNVAQPPVAVAAMLAMLYAPFALAGWVAEGTRKGATLHLSVSVTASIIFAIFAFGVLRPEHRTDLGIGFAIAGIAYVAAAIFTRSIRPSYVAAGFLALAALSALDSAALATALAAEAVACAFAGAILRDAVLRGFGVALLGLDAVWTGVSESFAHAASAFWNERFVSLAAVTAASFGVNAALALQPFRTKDDEALSRPLRLAAHAFGLAALTLEAHDFSSASAVSILWAVYAAALVVAGLRKRDVMLRWEGLALIVAAGVKVLCFDLASLPFEYRVLSGLAVGVVLIVVSWLYQRRAQEAV